ncbi:uncharacterized protein N7496_005604 [Penicillium cataractarum]|uniref:Apple domain-containing protein n=1 Tax=Penicillium cataractarum TaxID=2100454 RepID=A0A9W9SHN9_9EURO|nr:uncharacterized protein N7496_005604 [Penicillium cataractarum]KAJ5378195.1 hypothetical protein N7496_005604 [Penicillium cataractarum]
MGPFDNGWKDYLSCNEKIHTEIANCKAEETESCKKQIALLEQRLHAHYTKEIEKKCNNQFSHPLYGSDYKEWFRKEKASLEERLQAQCATAQLNAAAKCKSDQDTMREEHRKAQNQLEQEKEILKKQNFEHAQKAKNDQAAKEKLEREKEELAQENKKLKKQDDERVQKAKDDQAAKEKLERENEKLKAESRPEPKPQKIGPQNNSTSEFEAFSKQKCPSLHGQRATAFGVTYEAFCGARPRGRYTDDYVESKNFGDCMGACTVDRSCQGVYYETHLSRCRMTMDWEYPPLGWADSTEFSFVPVSPREGGIGATTPDLPSRLIKDDYMDNASCPDSDGSIVSVGSLQFRVHCRKYQPKKHLESVGSSRRVSGMLAICALNPACQGVAYSASSVYMIAEHEKLEEKTRNSDLVKAYHWVIMLTEPRVAA